MLFSVRSVRVLQDAFATALKELFPRRDLDEVSNTSKGAIFLQSSRKKKMLRTYYVVVVGEGGENVYFSRREKDEAFEVLEAGRGAYGYTDLELFFDEMEEE